jgi:hypothetical protein
MSPTNIFEYQKPVIVGLRGRAGAGKSTLASYLNEMETDVVRMSFAGPIRDALRTLGITKQDSPQLYRKLAQTIGQSARDADQDHWVKLAKQGIERECMSGRHKTPIIVFDDVRYPNEVILCDLVFYITPVGFNPLDLGDLANHESEKMNRKGPGDSIQILNAVGRGVYAAEEILKAVRAEVSRRNPRRR